GKLGLPRMRGDRPFVGYALKGGSKFTPHARGSTPPGPGPSRTRAVYPACAGIDRSCITPLVTMPRLPRMRGDRPLFFPLPRPTRMFTPHARGSTGVKMGKFGVVGVYPACAGIDRVH